MSIYIGGEGLNDLQFRLNKNYLFTINCFPQITHLERVKSHLLQRHHWKHYDKSRNCSYYKWAIYLICHNVFNSTNELYMYFIYRFPILFDEKFLMWSVSSLLIVLTIPNIKKIFSIRLRKHLDNNRQNLSIVKVIFYWFKLKAMWQKEK